MAKAKTAPVAKSAAKSAKSSKANAATAAVGQAPEIGAGDLAPAVALDNDDGKPFELSSLRGKIVVLYFYPKADTSGCTKESIAFGAALADFKKAGAQIVGISPDKVSSQKKFREKYSLPFPLLADVDHTVAEAYGAWKEKSMYGRTYFGIERSTFVIDGDGKIARDFRKVKVDGHAAAVLDAVKSLKKR